MKTKFVDTNILLEAYLREGDKAKRCLRLLKSDADLFTSWLVIGEFEWVLRSVYGFKRSEAAEFLGSVVSLENLEIPDRKFLSQALKIFREKNVDWADCLNGVTMLSRGAREVYSYDRDFDKIPGVKRLEP